MSKQTEPSGDRTYFVRFSVTALILAAGTLVLVLVVLPQRFVLSAGFRESGLNFPGSEIPFAPRDAVRVAARPSPRPPMIPTADIPPPGPAEILWERVGPLVDAGRFREALPIFEAYLADHPDDDDVQLQYANALIGAGRPASAVAILTSLLTPRGDPALRLQLARTLREMGRVDQADVHYRLLAEADPSNEALALEWSRAWAWAERYDEAARVLREALDASPRSVALRADLARVYYYSDRLEEADAILETLTDEELRSVDAVGLRDDVRDALRTPPAPEAEAPPEPTLLERAAGAREADDFDAARALFLAALADTPDDPAAWLAYANFLEYEMGDFAGARTALLEVERLGAAGPDLRFRIALLDAWTGRIDEADARLRALLVDLEAPPAPGQSPAEPVEGGVTPAEVRALLGDLRRWDGDRLAADAEYRAALTTDPDNQRALDGVNAVRVETSTRIEEVEAPRMGSHVAATADTDDFSRIDVAAEWVGVRDDWVWTGTAGRRWLSGYDLVAGSGDLRGMFFDVAPARWWRLGTVRTSLRFGAEWVGAGDPEISFGAALRYRSTRGTSSYEIDYAHGPAYSTTGTLQSLFADLHEDRFRASLERSLGELWTLAVQADITRLGVAGPTAVDGSTRLNTLLSVSRPVAPAWRVGLSGSALTYTTPAPGIGTLRLFWDPSLAVSVGPFAQVQGASGDHWRTSLRAGPALAVIDERGAGGIDLAPQLSAEARVEYEGPGLKAALDVFYGQARLEGYRAYGARLSIGTGSWLSKGPGR